MEAVLSTVEMEIFNARIIILCAKFSRVGNGRLGQKSDGFQEDLTTIISCYISNFGDYQE